MLSDAQAALARLHGAVRLLSSPQYDEAMTMVAVGDLKGILAHVEAQAAEIKRLREFAELWYFVMDEAPRDFERIVSEYQPKAWLQEAAKLRAARKEQR